MDLLRILGFGGSKQPAAQQTEVKAESASQPAAYTGNFTRAMPTTEEERLKISNELRAAASVYKGDKPGLDALEKRTEDKERITVGCRVTTFDENLSFKALPSERDGNNLTAVIRATDKTTYESLAGTVKQYGFTEVVQ